MIEVAVINQSGKAQKKPTQRREPRPRVDRQQDKDIKALKERNPSMVTPLIAGIARGLFPSHLVEATTGDGVVKVPVEKVVQVPEMEMPQETFMAFEFNEEPFMTIENRDYFGSFKADDELFQIEDVAVLKSTEKEPRFGRVMYAFYNRKLKKQMLHVRFLCHGKDTILEETAPMKELFLTDECKDLPLEAVLAKCSLQYLDVGTDEKDVADSLAGDYSFFYR
jgi:hypothetical protein